MSEDIIEDVDSPNNEDVVAQDEPKELGLPADPVEVEPKDTIDPNDSEELKAEKIKNQQLYEQLRKAQGLKRDPKTGKWVKKEQPKPTMAVQGTDDVTKTELYSLVKANVPDEDVNEVVIYARSHHMSVTDALKTAEVKAILGVKQEHRRSAQAAATNNSRYSSSKVSHVEILDKAQQGELADPAKLAEARQIARLEGRRTK